MPLCPLSKLHRGLSAACSLASQPPSTTWHTYPSGMSSGKRKYKLLRTLVLFLVKSESNEGSSLQAFTLRTSCNATKLVDNTHYNQFLCNFFCRKTKLSGIIRTEMEKAGDVCRMPVWLHVHIRLALKLREI